MQSCLITRRLTLAATAVLLAAASTGCATGSAPPAPASAKQAAASAAASAPAQPKITKILTFVVENHSLAQMRTEMPFVRRLARTYAYADHYTAITHPSLPNYLAIAAGSTKGVTDDSPPAEHKLRGKTVFDQAIARGRTATIYVDAMGSNCQLTSEGRYAVKHNPWAYFVDGRANCQAHDVPVRQLAKDAAAGKLPNAGMVVPDLVHDAHDAELATADAWIKKKVRMIQAEQDWKSGHLAIVITADEDDRDSGNEVLTVVASKYQDHRVVHDPLTHYSLTRLYGSVIGAPYLAQAKRASSMRAAFGITTRFGE